MSAQSPQIAASFYLPHTQREARWSPIHSLYIITRVFWGLRVHNFTLASASAGDPTGQRFRLKWGNSGAGTGNSTSSTTNTAPNSSSSTAASPAAGEHSIFVGDLPYDASDSDVTSFFQQFYPSCVGSHIVTDSATGKSRGYGFVRFTSLDEKLRALSEMPSKELGGRPLRVGEATPKPEARRGGANSSGGGSQGPAKVSSAPAGGIAPAVPAVAVPTTPVSWPTPLAGAAPSNFTPPNSATAPASAAGAGSIPPATSGAAVPPVLTPLAQGMPAGIPSTAGGTAGTNTDPAYQAAVAAVAAQAFAPQPAVTEGNTTVFVGGLDKNATEAEVRYHFHRCGPVSSVKVLQDKGCGFVQFQYRAHAETAIASLNGSVLGIGPLRLQWGKNAARNAMAAQATLPGAPAPAFHAGLQTHHHMGYGNAVYANGVQGGYPGVHMMPGVSMMHPGMAHLGGGQFHPGMAYTHGMPSGATHMHHGASAGLMSLHASMMGGSNMSGGAPQMPGAGQAPSETMHGGGFVGADLSLVAGTHDPWSFGAPEQKSSAPMWGSGPYGLSVSASM